MAVAVGRESSATVNDPSDLESCATFNDPPVPDNSRAMAVAAETGLSTDVDVLVVTADRNTETTEGLMISAITVDGPAVAADPVRMSSPAVTGATRVLIDKDFMAILLCWV